MLEETVITPELREELQKYSERPEDRGLLEACSESVVLFAKHMLGIELYTWQKLVALEIMKSIEDPTRSREFVIITSRQIGKTTLAAIMALWIAVFNKLPSDIGNNSDAGIISATDRQSKLVLKEINHFIRMGDRYCREHYSREPNDEMDKGILSMLIDEKEDNNKEMITFSPDLSAIEPKTGMVTHKFGSFFLKDSKIGTKIKSYPPTGSILGKKFAYLHEDEAGFAEKFDDEVHYEHIKPTGDARNAIKIYTSTPWVLSGFFYELCDPDDIKPEHDYYRFLFTIDAIKDENPKQYDTVLKGIQKMREDGKNSEVERAYYCRFVKGDESYFDPDKVDALFDDSSQLFSHDGPCDIGVDFGGQVKSRTVVTVSRYDPDAHTIHRLYHRAYEVGEDDSLLDDLEDIMRMFPRWQRIVPDDCAAGDFRIRQMRDRGWNVHPMSFRTWKVKKFGSFRAKLNRGEIRSYKDDELRVEMKALEFVMSAFFYLEEESGYEFYSWRDFK
jgi:hypothetical protein